MEQENYSEWMLENIYLKSVSDVIVNEGAATPDNQKKD